jgi:ubiquinone/menaquinone biosynthesis C-methylase UbiE
MALEPGALKESAKDRIRAEYDRLAPDYERHWARYVQASTQATLERVQLGPDQSLLDVGCGTGLLLARLLAQQPTAKLTGVDLSPGMVAQARARLPSTVPVLVADAEALPFPTSSFDFVVSVSSFHFWSSPGLGLMELRRVLRPGGGLVITDWCDDYLSCRICDRVLRLIDPAHGRIYGSAACAALLRESNCEVLRLDRYRIGWFWGLMTAVARAPSSS